MIGLPIIRFGVGDGGHMSHRLIRQLGQCDLKKVAFHLALEVKTHPQAYKASIAEAMAAFMRLPCPETAANLVYVWPDMLGVLRLTPEEGAEPAADPFGQAYARWVSRCQRDLEAVPRIHAFLQAEVASGRARIEIRATDGHAAAYQRLRRIGLKKGLFTSGPVFLSRTITGQLPAFRAVADLICIKGTADGQTGAWNGLGVRIDEEASRGAPVVYEFGPRLGGFVELLHQR
jgi:hypothetical protein